MAAPRRGDAHVVATVRRCMVRHLRHGPGRGWMCRQPRPRARPCGAGRGVGTSAPSLRRSGKSATAYMAFGHFCSARRARPRCSRRSSRVGSGRHGSIRGTAAAAAQPLVGFRYDAHLGHRFKAHEDLLHLLGADVLAAVDDDVGDAIGDESRSRRRRPVPMSPAWYELSASNAVAASAGSDGLVGKFCNEHREAAGVVVVAPSYAHRSESLTLAVHGDPADHRFVGKCSIVIIVVEVIGRRVVGDEKIRPPVVIVVSPGHAEAVIAIGIVHACLF